MTKSDLFKLWELVSVMPAQEDYRVAHLGSQCKPDVFVALNPDHQRCLILRSGSLSLKPIEKQKLHIKFDASIPGIVLELVDQNYQDLFDDLILSLYGVVKSIPESERQKEIFLRQFRKWAALFEAEYSNSLDEPTVMGLIGELYFLGRLISSSNDSELDNVLRSWRGPYDEAQDFILEDKLLEVKTISAQTSAVSINSLAQLTEEHGKALELKVLTASPDCDGGVCLSWMFHKVWNQVISRGGDSSILFEAIGQKGLSSSTIADYDHWKYQLHKEQDYDALNAEFPRLTRSSPSPVITKAIYTLSLAGLEPFLVREVDL